MEKEQVMSGAKQEKYQVWLKAGDFKLDQTTKMKDGNPVFVMDENGEKIPSRDKDGNLLKNKDGEQMYRTEKTFAKEEDGRAKLHIAKFKNDAEYVVMPMSLAGKDGKKGDYVEFLIPKKGIMTLKPETHEKFMAEKKDVLEEGVGINMAFKFYSKAANKVVSNEIPVFVYKRDENGKVINDSREMKKTSVGYLKNAIEGKPWKVWDVKQTEEKALEIGKKEVVEKKVTADLAVEEKPKKAKGRGK